MLSNLLPGFRHTRTPLIAGVLWLFAAWAWFGERLQPRHEVRVWRNVLQLTDFLGPHVLLTVVAISAVLLGGMIPGVPLRAITSRVQITNGVRPYATANWLLGLRGDVLAREGGFDHWFYRVCEFVPSTIQWSVFDRSDCPAAMKPWARDAMEASENWNSSPNANVITEVSIGSTRVDARDLMSTAPDYWLRFFFVEASVQEELHSGLPMQLQIAQESIYNEYDRVRSEAELRSSIVVPLVLVIGMFSIASPWWLVSLAIPIWLLRQGIRAQVESELILKDSVRFGAVQSETIQFVRSLVPPDKGSDDEA